MLPRKRQSNTNTHSEYYATKTIPAFVYLDFESHLISLRSQCGAENAKWRKLKTAGVAAFFLTLLQCCARHLVYKTLSDSFNFCCSRSCEMRASLACFISVQIELFVSHRKTNITDLINYFSYTIAMKNLSNLKSC